MYGICLSCDVKAAFSISQAKVSKFILKNGPAELTRGRISPFSAAAHASLSPICLARRIVASISNTGCSAGWLSLGTTLQPCRGPCDFSTQLPLETERGGERSLHDSYGWAHVDDMLFHLISWDQSHR